MSNQAVQVQILGRAIKVNCPAGQESALKAAAVDFDQRLQLLSDKTQVSNPEQLLTITALNVCYELHMAKSESDVLSTELQDRMQQLNMALEQALQNTEQLTAD
ncbi:cell division protein ZapA [Aliivibrio kagoshimensis]|jgi:cell division protein ZapA|uniref:cell division protein ZapA n=1 Tax=Aliivibrio kagoshimensis TaxID=2910230 RepID=UPI003D14AB15